MQFGSCLRPLKAALGNWDLLRPFNVALSHWELP
jgi:hypothetical protein